MPHYKAMFRYFCPNGHPNTTVKYYLAGSLENVESSLPQILPCSSCPPKTLLESPLNVSFEITEISESEFLDSRAQLEPESS